jgi:hypothetical protein
VHRCANRCRAISTAQPIDPKHGIMKRFNAQARQFEGHAGAHEAASFHGLNILEREAALPIMLGRTSREFGGMILSEFDQTRSRCGVGL